MKKVFIILFTCFISCAVFAQETEEPISETETVPVVKAVDVPKEIPPMYAGGVIGVDGHCGPYINHYFWSLGFEPHFGIYPFEKKNMGLEVSFRLAIPNSFNQSYCSYTESYTALLVRYLYEFKPFEEVPGLNLYGIAGAGLAFRKFVWHYISRDGEPYDVIEPVTSLTIPLGVGLRYQMKDNMEATAQAEFGLSYMLGINISIGLNYKF